MERITTSLALMVLVAACAGGQDAADTTGTTDGTTTASSSTDPSTTTSSPATAPSSSTRSTTATTTPTTITTTSLAGGELTACTSPEGYAISYPKSWSTNEGDAVPPCGMFNPEPFEVPEATDARVAAISVSIDEVGFVDATAPQEGRDAERAVTTVDGLPAVRLAYESTGPLYPEGTPIALYAIDIDPGPDAGKRTMFVTTVGTEGFDYERNQVVLDRMVRTLDVDMQGVSGQPGLVVRYEGGGGGYTVAAEAADGDVCLRIPPNGEPVCVATPAPDGIAPLELVDLRPIQAGVTGQEVFFVDVALANGDVSTRLPAPIPGSTAKGFALTAQPDEVVEFTVRDVTGEEIGTADASG